MKKQIQNLLYEALETEMGGVEVYTNAVKSARNKDLKEEWQKYLQQTTRHVEIVRGILETAGLDPDKETPGRQIVRHLGKGLVRAIEMARDAGEPDAAEIVAAECVVLAETKDHLNWELLGEIAKKLPADQRKAISEAQAEVEDQEDEHLYHTQGWTRELWLEHLGLPAVLPPPEEQKDVKTAIGAARAKQARKEMTHGRRGRAGASAS